MSVKILAKETIFIFPPILCFKYYFDQFCLDTPDEYIWQKYSRPYHHVFMHLNFLIFHSKKIVWTVIIYPRREYDGPHTALVCYDEDRFSR